MNLGDRVHAALSLIGVNKVLIEGWLGRPCGCDERRDKMNALGLWAAAALRGGRIKAAEHLRQLLGGEQ